MSRALVLTYHAIEHGDGPLFVDPRTFASHLDCIVASGAHAVTASELANLLRAGSFDVPTVALTFDDGIASVVRTAAPLLAERGLPATVFCVAGHMGGANDWASALPGTTRLELAAADELSALAAHGFEIGCHGMTHAPLDCHAEELLEHELVDARASLERVTGTRVRAYAYPYGAAPTEAARHVVEATYSSAWTTVAAYAVSGLDLHAVPRVDAHYLRRPRMLRAALAGALGPYLHVRRLGAGARRARCPDYRPASD